MQTKKFIVWNQYRIGSEATFNPAQGVCKHESRHQLHGCNNVVANSRDFGVVRVVSYSRGIVSKLASRYPTVYAKADITKRNNPVYYMVSTFSSLQLFFQLLESFYYEQSWNFIAHNPVFKGKQPVHQVGGCIEEERVYSYKPG